MEKYIFQALAAERRSIRKYEQRSVEREKLLYCLEAARLAPSACNAQPYRFIIADSPEFMARSKNLFTGIYSPCAFAAKAAALVFVVPAAGSLTARLGNAVRNTDFRLIDTGIAAEHFVLAAQEQGLGTCWLGWFNASAAADMLGLGRGEKPEIVISVGYPAEKPAARKRKSMAEFARFLAFAAVFFTAAAAAGAVPADSTDCSREADVCASGRKPAGGFMALVSAFSAEDNSREAMSSPPEVSTRSARGKEPLKTSPSSSRKEAPAAPEVKAEAVSAASETAAVVISSAAEGEPVSVSTAAAAPAEDLTGMASRLWIIPVLAGLGLLFIYLKPSSRRRYR